MCRRKKKKNCYFDFGYFQPTSESRINSFFHKFFRYHLPKKVSFFLCRLNKSRFCIQYSHFIVVIHFDVYFSFGELKFLYLLDLDDKKIFIIFSIRCSASILSVKSFVVVGRPPCAICREVLSFSFAASNLK